ncbi:MAG: DNA polymerase III subunit delta [Gammaproteobacteria bacterium]|nr:DNA polymerase III subunit delta [Gammaproteobacteria bacterium]
MQVKPTDLGSHLASSLAPVYFVSGDETLLVEETCDAVVAAARAQGFGERSVLYADKGFNWNDVLQNVSSMSLFSERRIVDVRVSDNKFDKEASEVLRECTQRATDDTLLLIRSARLDPRQRSSAWFKALDKAGVIVLIWPVSAAELPRWLSRRLADAGIKLDKEALQYFSQRVEGNLLAAVQEIEKLKLAALSEPIDVPSLTSVLEDSAHYDTFVLIDAVFAGELDRVSRIIVNLRQEGVALFAILGALTSQLRRLQSGGKLPPQRQRLVNGFLKRLGSKEVIDRVLSQCALVDQQGKGQLLGDAWLSLETLLLRLAGARLPSLETQLPYFKRA